jgi:hypothetical protein
MVVELKHHMNRHMVHMTVMAEQHTQAMRKASARVASTADFTL